MILNHFWFYFLVILLVAVNGEAAILLTASIASSGYFNPYVALIAVTLGNVISDSCWFALGYYGKMDWLLKKSRWLGISSDNVDLAQKIVRKDVVKLLIFSKLTNWITIPALVTAGFSKVPMKKWFPTVVISNFLIGVILMALGYYMSAEMMKIQSGLRYVAIILTLAFVLAAIFYVRKLVSGKDLIMKLAESEGIKQE